MFLRLIDTVLMRTHSSSYPQICLRTGSRISLFHPFELSKMEAMVLSKNISYIDGNTMRKINSSNKNLLSLILTMCQALHQNAETLFHLNLTTLVVSLHCCYALLHRRINSRSTLQVVGVRWYYVISPFEPLQIGSGKILALSRTDQIHLLGEMSSLACC